MKGSLLLAAVASASMSLGASFALAQGGTSAEARAMLEKGIAALKTDQTKALAQFNKRDSGFVDRDLYVFCYNSGDGKFTAHINQALLGQDVRSLKDGNGGPLGHRIFDANKAGTITTIDYTFPRPGTTNPVPKQSYITVVGNQGCGVGYYK